MSIHRTPLYDFWRNEKTMQHRLYTANYEDHVQNTKSPKFGEVSSNHLQDMKLKCLLIGSLPDRSRRGSTPVESGALAPDTSFLKPGLSSPSSTFLHTLDETQAHFCLRTLQIQQSPVCLSQGQQVLPKYRVISSKHTLQHLYRYSYTMKSMY